MIRNVSNNSSGGTRSVASATPRSVGGDPRAPRYGTPSTKHEVSSVVTYELDSTSNLQVKVDGETVWLTQAQMCQLFGRDRSVITKHINSVFKEGELPREGFVQILHKTSDAGGRPVMLYSLDVIISVGYRVKSFQGTRFRQWATRMLREMLLRRLDETKSIGALSERVSKVETDVEQLKCGMNYLVQQLTAPQDPPRRRIGFGASDDDPPTKPYDKLT